jgi:hypothetical protein
MNEFEPSGSYSARDYQELQKTDVTCSKSSLFSRAVSIIETGVERSEHRKILILILQERDIEP